MQKSLSILIVAALTMSGCASWRDSRANPTNWFGDSAPPPEDTQLYDANALVPEQGGGVNLLARPDAEDTSVPIARIDELRIDPTPSGAIVYAAGTATRQGAFNAQLVRIISEENQKSGTLEYVFRVVYPKIETRQGSERSRMISDAVNVSTRDLEGIRLVRVVGQQNALESRRR